MAARIGFSTGTSLLSRVIRWFTRSEVSHAFLLYPDKTFGVLMVMEASVSGFRVVPYSSFVKGRTIVAIFEPVNDLDPGLHKLMQWLGTTYDFGGLVGMTFVLLGRCLKRKWRNPLRSTDAMFCSEAVAVAMKASGYPGTENWIPDRMDPDTVLKHLKTTGSMAVTV
jgi:hypothetical protein